MNQYPYGFGARHKSYVEPVFPGFKEIGLNKNSDSFSLIVPAYNEEERIGSFLQELKLHLPLNWEVILVCDGNDKTADIARSIDYPIKILEFNKRLGKGGAILEGFRIAQGDVIGYTDADGAILPEDIFRVFHSITGPNMVAIGSRWVKGAKVEKRQPLARIILGRLYHYFTFAFLGIRHKDTQCGIKALSHDVVKKLFNKVTLNNLSFDTALLYHCKKIDVSITEVPITWRNVEGSKVNTVRTSIVMLLSIIGIRLAHSKNRRRFDKIITAVRNLTENI